MNDRTKVQYRFDVDYDILVSCSKAAFEAEYCSPVLVTNDSALLVYDLYVDRYKQNPDLSPGRKIGEFEVQRCNGWNEVRFYYHRVQHNPEWTDAEKKEGKSLSAKKRKEYVGKRLERIAKERAALQKGLDERLHKIMDVYFRYLEERDIRLSTPTGSANTKKTLEIEDPTDRRIWEWIDKDRAITDTDISQRLKISRQAVNTRRQRLISAGYPAKRKVSRQKR